MLVRRICSHMSFLENLSDIDAPDMFRAITTIYTSLMHAYDIVVRINHTKRLQFMQVRGEIMQTKASVPVNTIITP